MRLDEVLVVVHPGSACGSANMNLGHLEAGAAREELALELDRWLGPVVVIHGELSDELPDFPRLNRALQAVLTRARDQGVPADEVAGDDDADHNQVAAITAWINQQDLAHRRPVFRVTGAWYHPEDAGGCVGSVVDQLTTLGHSAKVSASAVNLSWNETDEADEEMPAEMTFPTAQPRRRRRR